MRLLLTVAFLVCCFPAFAQGIAVTPNFDRMQRGGFDVVAIMEDRFRDTLALLKSEFPPDHTALTTGLAAVDRLAGEENALLIVAFKQLTELKRKYAQRLRFAPSAAHAAMVGRLAVFYDLVFKEEGPEACGRFARDGSAALFELGLSEKYARAIDQQAAAYFEAVVMAIEMPEPSERVTPEDWEAIMTRMIEAGAPPTFAATINSGDPGDPNLCPALAALLITISLMDTPEGARARADFAQNLAGY